MTETQKTGNKNTALPFSMAFRDLVLLIASIIVVLILSYFFDVFVLIVNFLKTHPDRIVFIDEVFMSLLSLNIGLAIFAFRRLSELKKETAERIKKQQELLRLTATQAEVERIISKQLRNDMDQMKQDVRDILRVLNNNAKR